MKTLNIIGGGRVGRTIASLWHASHTFAVQGVLDRTAEGARSAVAFIGAGAPAETLATLPSADVWMLTTPDGAITAASVGLAASGLLRRGDVVFHCSGSTSSAELAAASACGAHVASVHPLKTFADPRHAAATFSGTYCAAEGDPAALAVLRPAFEGLGARLSEIDSRRKTIYHAASVVVCNYLTALVEIGLRSYARAGLPRETASAMIEPIVRETVDNVFRMGTARALTGPIARGDDAVVARHLEALGAWDPRVAALYRDLGAVAVELAREQGEAEADALARIEALFKRS